MSQKNPKLPQLDLAVHGSGYLEENYGKRHLRFSEIPSEVDISNSICDAFRILFWISISETICDLFWMISRIFTVC